MFSVITTKKIWLSISGVLIAASLVAVAVFGLRLGIDFTGGSLMDIEMTTAPTTDELRTYVENLGYTDVRVQPSENNQFFVRLPSVTEEQHQELLESLKSGFGEIEEHQFQSVGPVFGAELMRKATWSVVLVLILITLYVAYAFRKVADPIASWKYGVVTMLAAFHDMIIPIGVFAVLGQFLEFQIDSAFVAAILTVLGYSINDTIVVFDRIRENLMHRSSAESLTDVVNKSIRQTAARSVNTSMTTLLALTAVFFFGGESTRSFALAMIIGILSGTYSSIFVASPLLVVWEKWDLKRRA